MFKMRREQMAAFREDALRDFEDRALAHVARCFPDNLATLGEDAARRVIRLGIQRAGGYGIVGERNVCKFIDLMLVFGVEFDRECAWAREVLEATAHEDPVAAMDILHERGLAQA